MANPAVIVGGILILCIIFCVVVWLFTRKKEGDECDPTGDEKVLYSTTYEYDSEGKCTVSNCLTNYTLSGGQCVAPTPECGHFKINDDGTTCSTTECVSGYNLTDGQCEEVAPQEVTIDGTDGTDMSPGVVPPTPTPATPATPECNNFIINADGTCSTTECVTGYSFNEESTMCELVSLNPLDGLTLVTENFTDSSKLWRGTGNMFRLSPGKYMESTEPNAPEDGKILGMYLTEDEFVVYRRNEDSSLFEPIWTHENEHKDVNEGDWSLKIYRDNGKMRLDGAPTPDDANGNLFNGSQWQQTQSGTEPFKLYTGGDCPYVFMRDSTETEKDLIPSTEYCDT